MTYREIGEALLVLAMFIGVGLLANSGLLELLRDALISYWVHN